MEIRIDNIGLKTLIKPKFWKSALWINISSRYILVNNVHYI